MVALSNIWGIIGLVSTAISILVGIHLRNKYRAQRSLAGVEAELESNRERATEIIKDISEDIQSDLSGEERRSRAPPKLKKSAFDSFSDSGYSSSIPDSLWERLETHYTQLEEINRDIESRNKRTLGGGNDQPAAAPVYDDGGTVLDIFILCSEEHENDILDEISGSEVYKSSQLLRSLIGSGKASMSDTAMRDDIDFDSLRRSIEDHLDEKWLIKIFGDK